MDTENEVIKLDLDEDEQENYHKQVPQNLKEIFMISNRNRKKNKQKKKNKQQEMKEQDPNIKPISTIPAQKTKFVK